MEYAIKALEVHASTAEFELEQLIKKKSDKAKELEKIGDDIKHVESAIRDYKEAIDKLSGQKTRTSE